MAMGAVPRPGAGGLKKEHWHVYLPALVLSVVAKGGLFSMERRAPAYALLLSIGLVLIFAGGLERRRPTAAHPG